VYKKDFEEAFLAATEVYYTAESTQFIAVNSVSDYMKKVELRLQEEEHRIRIYLHQSTQTDVRGTLFPFFISLWGGLFDGGVFQPRNYCLIADIKSQDLKRIIYSACLSLDQVLLRFPSFGSSPSLPLSQVYILHSYLNLSFLH